ncbi:MAG: hypothetical protein IT290_05555 [Deltaproteobacteria bacterium]|nr:hypothetical protein [Deltaproteobacteria bacterium]
MTGVSATDRRAMLKIQLFGASVFLILCFLLGIALGFKKNLSPVYAVQGSRAVGTNATLSFPIADGLNLSTFGRDTKLNGQPVEMASFTSRRSVREIAREQARIWERNNISTVKQIDDTRALVLGRDDRSGKRHTLLAWNSDSQLKEAGFEGVATQGMFSSADGSFTNVEVTEVPGVPLPDGGRVASVMSSLEPEGPSYSGSYALRGRLADNLSFYRRNLHADGWQETLVFDQPGQAMLELSKYRESITMIFVPVDGEGIETIATIVRRFTS